LADLDGAGLCAGAIAVPEAGVHARVVPALTPRVAVIVAVTGRALATATVVATGSRTQAVLVEDAWRMTSPCGAQSGTDAIDVVLAIRCIVTSRAVGVTDLIPGTAVGDAAILTVSVKAQPTRITVTYVSAGSPLYTQTAPGITPTGSRTISIALAARNTSSAEAIAFADAVDVRFTAKGFDAAAALAFAGLATCALAVILTAVEAGFLDT